MKTGSSETQEDVWVPTPEFLNMYTADVIFVIFQHATVILLTTFAYNWVFVLQHCDYYDSTAPWTLSFGDMQNIFWEL